MRTTRIALPDAVVGRIREAYGQYGCTLLSACRVVNHLDGGQGGGHDVEVVMAGWDVTFHSSRRTVVRMLSALNAIIQGTMPGTSGIVAEAIPVDRLGDDKLGDLVLMALIHDIDDQGRIWRAAQTSCISHPIEDRKDHGPILVDRIAGRALAAKRANVAKLPQWIRKAAEGRPWIDPTGQVWATEFVGDNSAKYRLSIDTQGATAPRLLVHMTLSSDWTGLMADVYDGYAIILRNQRRLPETVLRAAVGGRIGDVIDTGNPEINERIIASTSPCPDAWGSDVLSLVPDEAQLRDVIAEAHQGRS